MFKFIKENFCSILLVLLVAGILINSVVDGFQRMVFQYQIDETYRIHK